MASGEVGRGNLVRVLADKHALMNLNPWNSNEGFGCRRPDRGKAAAMTLALYRREFMTKRHESAGMDIDGGGGQLRERTENKPQRTAAIPPAR